MESNWKSRIHDHKTALIIGGVVVIVAAGGTVVFLVSKGKLPALAAKVPFLAKLAPKVAPQVCEVTTEAIEQIVKTFDRTSFIRHLHPGQHASPEKIAQALKMGIELNPGETIVDACKVIWKVA